METNTFVITAVDAGKRLDVFLQEKLPELTRSHIKKLVEKQKILVEKKVVKAGLSLKTGM